LSWRRDAIAPNNSASSCVGDTSAIWSFGDRAHQLQDHLFDGVGANVRAPSQHANSLITPKAV